MDSVQLEERIGSLRSDLHQAEGRLALAAPALHGALVDGTETEAVGKLRTDLHAAKLHTQELEAAIIVAEQRLDEVSFNEICDMRCHALEQSNDLVEPRQNAAIRVDEAIGQLEDAFARFSEIDREGIALSEQALRRGRESGMGVGRLPAAATWAKRGNLRTILEGALIAKSPGIARLLDTRRVPALMRVGLVDATSHEQTNPVDLRTVLLEQRREVTECAAKLPVDDFSRSQN